MASIVDGMKPIEALEQKAAAASRMADAGKAFVPTQLRKAAQLYEERNKLYGDNYKRFGSIMVGLFPNGLKIETMEDWNRLAVFVHIMTRTTRYANLFNSGGHVDSLDDMCVYSMMLQELDEEKRR